MAYFAGKVALITGGARGLGAATAHAMAARGARVVIADLEETAEARAAGHRFAALDVQDRESWRSTLADLTRQEGRLDILHLNAGVISRPLGDGANRMLEDDPLDWVTDDIYARVVGVNVSGAVNGVIAALPLLKQSGGSIVITGSLAGVRPFAPDPIYALSKHALVGLTRSLGPSLAAHGIGIGIVCPGGMDTRMIPPALRTDALVANSPDHVARVVCDAAEARAAGGVWLVFDNGTVRRQDAAIGYEEDAPPFP